MYIAVLLWLVFGTITAVVAVAQYRGVVEGFLLGFLLGPIGQLIEILLPARKPPRPVPSGSMSEYSDMPLVWNEDRIDEAEVDRIING